MKPDILKSIIIVISAALLIPVLFYLYLYVTALMDSKFTWKEMDLNNNGFVTFSEASYVSSSGARKIQVNGKECIEHFAYKDGLPVKIVCNDNVL